MFDLFTGKVQHVPSTPTVPILVSSTIQGTALAFIALMSFVVASRELPPVPDVFAFVAEMPAAVPPLRRRHRADGSSGSKRRHRPPTLRRADRSTS
jgi:hypothetical protein